MALLSSISNRPFAALAHASPLSKLPVSPRPPFFALSQPFPRLHSPLSAPSPLACSFSSLLGRNPNLRPILSPGLQLKPSRMAGSASATAVTEKSLHDFTVKSIDEKDVELSVYKGKVLLVVNVASRCGLTTSNYTELSQLYDKFKGQDFEILAFPCNQFGGQEPGSNEQIKEFACSRFKAEFPIFDKVEVNGANTAPVYKFLKSSKTGGILGGLLGDNIKWNFSKFLVDKNGQVVQRYAPTTSPLQIEDDIKKLLDS